MIILRGLTKEFDGVAAVKGLSLEIGDGELFGLLGPNGAGKTTTIKMLTTLLRPTSGEIIINGCDISRNSLAVKGDIGVAPQHLNLNKDLTAYQNLYFHGRFYKMSGPEIQKRAAELLEYVGLTEKADTLVEKFSGGMKRRLLIARALMHNPSILFLDEPTVGLDPQTRRKIWDLIKDMHRRGVTILLTTHYYRGGGDALREGGHHGPGAAHRARCTPAYQGEGGASFNGITTNLNISRIYFRTYEEVQIAPVHPLSIALGYTFTGAFRGLLASSLVLAVALFFRVHMHMNPWFILSLLLPASCSQGLVSLRP